MSAGFQDHFSSVAAQYARFRPGYPDALFDWLAAQCARRDCVWDCATGSGQAALPLAARFARVLATDASAEQIARAPAHPGVEYRVATAEASGLPDACADLVTVAQALHWFEHDAFWREVRRILRPGGVIAAWTYGRCVPDDEPVRAIIRRWYADVTGPYWPPIRLHVDNDYRTIPFPFAEFAGPVLDMRAFHAGGPGRLCGHVVGDDTPARGAGARSAARPRRRARTGLGRSGDTPRRALAAGDAGRAQRLSRESG